MTVRMMCAALAAGIMIGSGCENAAERCNMAKVAASDAWTPIEAGVKETCALLSDPLWDRIEPEAREGLRGLASGATTDREAEALNISMCAETYRPILKSACRGASTARAAATQGAVAARDAASGADQALAALPDSTAAFGGCVRKVKLRDYVAVRDLVDKHCAHVASAPLGPLRTKALAASSAAFERCQRVSP